ncbi:hypothetical protein [Paenibacillus hunanensis]|nr:hypothetical protein [Paenibacillus hunanensis]
MDQLITVNWRYSDARKRPFYDLEPLIQAYNEKHGMGEKRYA